MSRPIGIRIMQACELLEKHGPMGATSLCDYAPDVEPGNMGKYCSRAVGLGMMTVERGLRNKSNYSVYTVVNGWREIAKERRTTKKAAVQPRAEPVRAPNRWANISSIFQMGAA